MSLVINLSPHVQQFLNRDSLSRIDWSKFDIKDVGSFTAVNWVQRAFFDALLRHIENLAKTFFNGKEGGFQKAGEGAKTVSDSDAVAPDDDSCEVGDLFKPATTMESLLAQIDAINKKKQATKHPAEMADLDRLFELREASLHKLMDQTNPKPRSQASASFRPPSPNSGVPLSDGWEVLNAPMGLSQSDIDNLNAEVAAIEQALQEMAQELESIEYDLETARKYSTVLEKVASFSSSDKEMPLSKRTILKEATKVEQLQLLVRKKAILAERKKLLEELDHKEVLLASSEAYSGGDSSAQAGGNLPPLANIPGLSFTEAPPSSSAVSLSDALHQWQRSAMGVEHFSSSRRGAFSPPSAHTGRPQNPTPENQLSQDEIVASIEKVRDQLKSLKAQLDQADENSPEYRSLIKKIRKLELKKESLHAQYNALQEKKLSSSVGKPDTEASLLLDQLLAYQKFLNNQITAAYNAGNLGNLEMLQGLANLTEKMIQDQIVFLNTNEKKTDLDADLVSLMEAIESSLAELMEIQVLDFFQIQNLINALKVLVDKQKKLQGELGEIKGESHPLATLREKIRKSQALVIQLLKKLEDQLTDEYNQFGASLIKLTQDPKDVIDYSYQALAKKLADTIKELNNCLKKLNQATEEVIRQELELAQAELSDLTENLKEVDSGAKEILAKDLRIKIKNLKEELEGFGSKDKKVVQTTEEQIQNQPAPAEVDITVSQEHPLAFAYMAALAENVKEFLLYLSSGVLNPEQMVELYLLLLQEPTAQSGMADFVLPYLEEVMTEELFASMLEKILKGSNDHLLEIIMKSFNLIYLEAALSQKKFTPEMEELLKKYMKK